MMDAWHRPRLSDDSQTPQRPRPRIESLSDMVFGLALSVGAISLVSSPPTSASAVVSDIATFGFSFMILINIWIRYTRIMSVLPLESRRVINLNVILLFLVSVEPFLFNIVNRPPAGVKDPATYGNLTTALLAVDLGLMGAILGFFTLTLADEEKKLIPADTVAQFRREGVTWFVFASFFLVSALPFFYDISLPPFGIARFDLWIVPLLFIWVRRRATKMWATDEGPSVERSRATSSEERPAL